MSKDHKAATKRARRTRYVKRKKEELSARRKLSRTAKTGKTEATPAS